MDIKEIEARIIELKEQQSSVFKKKKIERNSEHLETVREELNELKSKAHEHYRAKK